MCQNLFVVCPKTGRAVGFIADRLNTSFVQTFLDQFAATIPIGIPVALVWDNAGYHTAKALRLPPTITLVPSHRTRLNLTPS